MRERRWPAPQDPPAKHPYRDTALVFGGMAVVIVLAAWVTGGDLVNAVVIAVVFFAVTTAWSWRRLRRQERERAKAPEAGARRPAS